MFKFNIAFPDNLVGSIAAPVARSSAKLRVNVITSSLFTNVSVVSGIAAPFFFAET